MVEHLPWLVQLSPEEMRRQLVHLLYREVPRRNVSLALAGVQQRHVRPQEVWTVPHRGRGGVRPDQRAQQDHQDQSQHGDQRDKRDERDQRDKRDESDERDRQDK